MPQALLFLILMLILTMLFLNIMLFTLAPQYVMYGSQHYTVKTHHTAVVSNHTANINGTHGNVTHPTNTTPVTPKTQVCSTDAPEDKCLMTRAAVFLNRFFYKVWFFGACYYWGTWLFLGIYVIGLGVSVAKKRKSVVDEELDSSDDDSDEELIRT